MRKRITEQQFLKTPKAKLTQQAFVQAYLSIIMALAVILFLIPANVCGQSTGQQQGKVITGVITDQAGMTLPGVSIVVKGSITGTTSDIDGMYRLSDIKTGDVLVYSFMGMRSEERVVADQTSINVVMQSDLVGLDEVVVIGYGTMKRSDLTGSVVSVTSDDLNRFPSADINEMLRGQAAGVQVSLSNASPGGGSSVLVRGNRSLSSSQSPLYIVDGMTVPHIDDLNSSDISSIEILKDASSQAIYGARASNGVILITTRRGEAGKMSVDLHSYTGIQQFSRNFELYSPEEWAELRFWAKYNDGQAGVGEPDDINYQTVFDDEIMYNAWVNNQFIDWEDLMLGNAAQHRHDLSIRGGNERVKYAAGLGYLNQDGVVQKSGYERANFRLNTDFAINSWLDVGSNISFSKSQRQLTDGRFNEFITRPSLAQPFDDDGNIRREVTGEGNINPLWRIDNYDQQQLNEYLILSGFAKIQPASGLSYKFSANIRSNNRESGLYKTKDYPVSTGEGSISNFHRSSWLIDNVLTYQLPLNENIHDLTLTLIQSVEQDLQKTTGLDFINSSSDLFRWNVAADSEVSGVSRGITRTQAVSFAGRIHYNLLDRYLFTATLRRDGASVFGPENKWANFPSMAFGWRINEEGFLKDVRWLDLLRLRASYGVVGNWAIPAYRTQGLAISDEYIFGSDLYIGYLPGNELLNPGLRWETTSSANFGFDFTAFGGRLSSIIEYYNTSTEDLLIRRTIPSLTGYGSMWDNLGETASRGWDFSISGKPVVRRDFSLSVGATVSVQRNEIVRIDGRLDEEGNPINDLNNRWFIGESINVLYNYVFGGIWQEDDIENVTEDDYLPGDAAPIPGDVRLYDYNGDGKITTDDRAIFNLDPSWYGSFNVKTVFKGLDLTLDFYTVQGVTSNNNYMYSFDQGGSLNGKLNGMKVNYWTPLNRSNEAPRPMYSGSVSYMGTLGIQDASYFRLRSATIGYSLPESILANIRITNLRLYFTGSNLYTLTDYKSYSPERSAGGYPEAQTFIFGLNASF